MNPVRVAFLRFGQPQAARDDIVPPIHAALGMLIVLVGPDGQFGEPLLQPGDGVLESRVNRSMIRRSCSCFLHFYEKFSSSMTSDPQGRLPSLHFDSR